MRIFFITFLCLMGFLSLQAQTDSLVVKAAGRYLGDSVVVRWAPANYATWLQGIASGYTLERSTIRKKGKILSPTKARASRKKYTQVFKPAAQEYWEKLMQNNKIAGLGAAAIYGEGFAVSAGNEKGFAQVLMANEEQKNRFNFGLLAADRSVAVAKAMGLAFVDYEVEKDEEYLYKIVPVIEKQGTKFMPGLVLASYVDQKPLAVSPEIKALFEDEIVHLVWDATSYMSEYSTYYIEKSVDDGVTFTTISDKFLTPANDKPEKVVYMFLDSLVDNEKVFHYRIRGRTIFEELGPASPSISGHGVAPKLNANVNIENITEFPEGQMQVKWLFNKNLNAYIKGFHLFRATSKYGEYKQITGKMIPSGDRIYTDKNPLSLAYYKIIAYDNNGYELSSYAALTQLIDIDCPEPPSGLKGKVDEKGLVSLQWIPNTEDDLKGYRVFISNQKKGEFTQVTPKWVTDTSYTYEVTMNTLSEEVYFKVLAEDFHSNYSKLSAICIVKRPDTRPPTPPVFLSCVSETDGVYLKWANSTSKDVVEHILIRTPSQSLQQDTIWSQQQMEKISSFVDRTSSAKYNYAYYLQAIDDAGLITSSKKIYGKRIDNGKRPLILNFTAKPNKYTKEIILNWSYPVIENIREVVIYRAKQSNALSTYRVLKKTDLLLSKSENAYDFQFMDKIFDNTKGYSYKVMIRFEDNSISPPTKVVITK